MREVQAIYSGAAGAVAGGRAERDRQRPQPDGPGHRPDDGRIASVVPNIIFTPKKNNVRKEQRRAMTAQRVMQGYWQSNKISMKS